MKTIYLLPLLAFFMTACTPLKHSEYPSQSSPPTMKGSVMKAETVDED
ncbi:MAG: hypothetical protein JHC93_02610 [Parachlamydiales bacterium]|nr:hypothetical protein [Parachlamydiales bacterium]